MPFAKILEKINEKSEMSYEEKDFVVSDALDDILEEGSGQPPQSLAEKPLNLPENNDDGNAKASSDKAGKISFAYYLQRGVALEDIIENIFWEKEPEFKEYLRFGYNLNGLDRDALSRLEGILHAHAPEAGSQLIISDAREFLHKITTLALPSEISPELQQHLGQVNTMTTTLCLALEALDLAGTVNGRVAAENNVVSQQLHALADEAQKTLPTDTLLTVSDKGHISTRTEAGGQLHGESNDRMTSHPGFKKLTGSLLAEDRLMRRRLAGYLDSTADQLHEVARRSGEYARGNLDALHDPSRPSARRVLSLIDRISFAIRIPCEALDRVAETLRQQAAALRPAQEESPGAGTDLWQDTVAFSKQFHKNQRDRVKGYATLARSVGLKLQKEAGKARPRLGLQPAVYSAGVKGAVKETGLLLLEELHQIERRLKLLPAEAWTLQEAVEQRQSLLEPVAHASALPVLDTLLAQQREREVARWQLKISRAEEKLTMLLSPVTLFAEEKWANDLYYQLSTVLHQAQLEKGEWPGIGQFEDMMTAAIGEFSRIAREINASVLRLAGHGHTGGADLHKKIRGWLQELDRVKKRIDAKMATIAGDSPGYYSRAGMLARGMAEWAEGLKQDYLRETMPEDNAAAAADFERALLGVVKKQSFVFRKKSDPEAKIFGLRLERELQHAAQGTTTYPLTPEEILAGSHSLEDDFRRWAQKRVISGAISAALSQGFKLVSGPLSLSGRIVMRSIRTGHALYAGLKEMDRGVRFGQGPAGGVKAQFIRNQLSRAGVRLTLSISPLAGWGISAAITGTRLYREDNYAKTLVTESLNDLPEDLLWRGGFAAGSMMFNRVYRLSAEEALAKSGALQEEDNRPLTAQEIEVNIRERFNIAGDPEFCAAVHQHLVEIQKTPSGRALIRELKNRIVDILPPREEDLLRAEQGGGRYYNARAEGNAVYFDPYNTFYGKSEAENPEAWRHVTPDIVLFHELLHILRNATGHDEIVPSVADWLDENDYRREHYASRGQDVIERGWDPTEKNMDYAGYANVDKPYYTQEEEFTILKNVLRANLDNHFIQSHQPKNPPAMREGELLEYGKKVTDFSLQSSGSEFIYLDGKFFPVKKINHTTFYIKVNSLHSIYIGRDSALSTEWRLKYPERFTNTIGYYDKQRSSSAGIEPPINYSYKYRNIDQSVLLKSLLDIRINNGYAPVNTPEYSYDIREGDIVDSDGMAADVKQVEGADERWIYLQGVFWPIYRDSLGEHYIMTGKDTYDFIIRVPGYYTRWQLRFPDRYYQDQALMTTVNNLTTGADDNGSPVSYEYVVDFHNIRHLQDSLKYRTNTATPVTSGAIEEGDIVDSNGYIVLHTAANAPGAKIWRGSSTTDSDLRFIYINGKYWQLAKDAAGNLYIKTENIGSYKKISLKGDVEQAGNNISGVRFRATGADAINETNSYFVNLRNEETDYYNKTTELSNDLLNAENDYATGLENYQGLTKSEKELSSEGTALKIFNAELNNNNSEIANASKEIIKKLIYLQKIRAERKKYLRENNDNASLRYDFSRYAEAIKNEQARVIPRFTLEERIIHLEMDYNKLNNKIINAGRKPDSNEKKNLERIIFKINFCRLLINLQHDESTIDQSVDDISYDKLPDFLKEKAYTSAITNSLFKIENDPSIPLSAQMNAHEARIGKERVTGVDIYGYQLDNCFFIPDDYGAKTGVLVNLDSPDKYHYIRHQSDLPADLIKRLPFSSGSRYNLSTGGPWALTKVRSGEWDFETYFNYTERPRVNVVDMSKELFQNFDKDKDDGKNHLSTSGWRGVSNKEDLQILSKNLNVIHQAFVGKSIPNPEFNPIKTVYTGTELEIDSEPTHIKTVRGIAHPFETSAEQIQREICINNKDSVEEARIKIKAAKRIGVWFDVTFSAAVAFVPGGAAISVLQASADITADLLEGKGVDSLAIASLVVSLIPGGKIAKMVGKTSRVGAQVIKYGILVSEKTIDAVQLTLGIKTAVETGEPIHIYQCLINAGLTGYDVKKISDGIFKKLKRTPQDKTKADKQAAKIENGMDTTTWSLDQVDSSVKKPAHIPNNKQAYSNQRTTSGRVVVRPYTISGTLFHGRKKDDIIEFSRDGGKTWTPADNIHTFAFVMQNAGGKNKFPGAELSGAELSGSELSGSELSDSDTSNEGSRSRLSEEPTTDSSSSSEQIFHNRIENGDNPERALNDLRRHGHDGSERGFKFLDSEMKGRIHDGVFQISKDGQNWTRGSWYHEAVWQFKSHIDEIKGRISFNKFINAQETRWPPVKIEKNIHMIWIGTRNISDKNTKLSLDTAKLNADYNTSVIYDSAIPGHEGAMRDMAAKFQGSNIKVIDFRQKQYLSDVSKEPTFPYYEQAVREGKYAQASDLLRLYILKYEGGIYKDIDDIQVKSFGDLSFPKGIGVMEQYAPEKGKKTAFPNTPVAASRGNEVTQTTLNLAEKNYKRNEEDVLKLAGPDVFTEALRQEIPALDPAVLRTQLDQLEQVKRKALNLPLETPKGFADAKLTASDIGKFNAPYKSIKGLTGFVENGADHSWATNTQAPEPKPDTSKIDQHENLHQATMHTEERHGNASRSRTPEHAVQKTSSGTQGSSIPAHSLPLKGESVLPQYTHQKLTPDGESILYGAREKLMSNLGSRYSHYVLKPKENCNNAAKDVSQQLRLIGYEDVRIVTVGFWPHGGENALPTNHYVVMARRDNIEFVVDLTAGQFEHYGLTGPIIDTKNNWIAIWQQKLKERPRTLVKIAPVHGGLDTSPFSAFSPYVDARKTVPDGELLHSPSWYNHTIEASRPAQHADGTYPRRADENLDVTQATTAEDISASQQTLNFERPFGPDSFMEMGPSDTFVIIRAHGYPGDTGHYKAKHVAKKVRGFLASSNIRIGQITHVELQSCYGATFGKAASQSQAIANHLGVKVKGYHGKFTERRGLDPDDGVYYKPHKRLAATASNMGNRAVYHSSEAILALRRKLAVETSSEAQEGNSREYSVSSQPARRPGRVVVPNSFNVLREENHGLTTNNRMNTGRHLTDTRPVTDAYGQVMLRAILNVPARSKAKAGVIIGGMLVLGGVGIAGWQHEVSAKEARESLEDAEENLSKIIRLKGSNDQDLNKVEKFYFGKKLSVYQIQEIINFIKKIRLSATDDDLKQLFSGKLPARFERDIPPAITRVRPEKLMRFYINVFGEDAISDSSISQSA